MAVQIRPGAFSIGMFLRWNNKKMTAVGFEPTRIAPPELESGALDRSAKLSSDLQQGSVACSEVPFFEAAHRDP